MLFACAFVLWTLHCSAAQTIPTAAPEDYTFKWRRPEGCTTGTAGNCTYFVGIQLNAGDAAFLDFYLEGSQAGWVAIGFSGSNNMVSTISILL